MESIKFDPYNLFPLVVSEKGINVSSPRITPFSKLPEERRLIYLPKLVNRGRKLTMSKKYWQAINTSFEDIFLGIEKLCDHVVYEYDPDRYISRAAVISLQEPNGWSAYQAIGLPFDKIHENVKTYKDSLVFPDSDQILQRIMGLQEPHERIGALSLRENTKLDRHPDNWVPDTFENGEVYLRFERQGIQAYPEIKAFLFTIQTVFVDLLDPEYGRPFLKGVEVNGDKTYFREILTNERGQRAMNLIKEACK